MKRPKRSGAVAKSAHLLDTSTLLWALGDPERLSAKARRLVEAGRERRECRVLLGGGDQGSEGPVVHRRSGDVVATSHGTDERRILHIRPSHITQLSALPLLYKDPFDRILIAQAKTEDLGILTSDGSIGEYPVQTLW